ncbi:MAG: YkgJ family cysteine cluster protein [Thermodesulfobacteriota bacterium]|nr:YkgJ family cysteine cluster protein [Thermodesulfobacteriota bacterium]
MDFDFTEIFKKYEALAAEADVVFERVRELHGDLVRCSTGCSDCCFALFDLSLVEAMYLNHRFNREYEGEERSRILDKADRSERHYYKIKRKAAKAIQEGVRDSEILESLAKERIRCPLLNEKDLCDLYEYRPITCRLYGIPLEIGGKAQSCSNSGFKEGASYPTVRMERIQDRLVELSRELISGLETRHVKMADMLVPVGMALMNVYDEKYLGIGPEDEEETSVIQRGSAGARASGSGDGAVTWDIGGEEEK